MVLMVVVLELLPLLLLLLFLFLPIIIIIMRTLCVPPPEVNPVHTYCTDRHQRDITESTDVLII